MELPSLGLEPARVLVPNSSSIPDNSSPVPEELRSGQFQLIHPASFENLPLLVIDDSVMGGPAPMTDTPESAIRGPALPAHGDTVLSPVLQKAGEDDNPSSGQSLTLKSLMYGH